MHIKKVKLAALGGLLAHDLRFEGDGLDHVQIGQGQREKIDPERTHLNRVVVKRPDGNGWTMQEPTKRHQKAAMSRLHEAERKHREIRGRRIGANAVTASLVAHRPPDWPGTDEEFVEVTASYFDSCPGETLAMVVHYDEVTPHVHCVKLLTSDDGTLKGFNSVYDRSVYQHFHEGMVEFSESMGFRAAWMLDEEDEVGKALSGLDHRRYGIVMEKLGEALLEVDKREAALDAREASLNERESALDVREALLNAREVTLQDTLKDAQKRSSEALRAVLKADKREFALDAREEDLNAKEEDLRRREMTLGLRAEGERMQREPNFDVNDGMSMTEIRV